MIPLIYRLSLVDNCSDLKRQTINLLDQIFPEYDKQFSDIFGVTSKELLSKCPTPEDIMTISTKKLSDFLNKHSMVILVQKKLKNSRNLPKMHFHFK